MVRISDVRLQHLLDLFGKHHCYWPLLATDTQAHVRAQSTLAHSVSNLFSQSVVTYSSDIENFSILAHGWHAGAPAAPLLVTAKVLIVAFIAS